MATTTTKPKLVPMPARTTAEPAILRDQELADGLKRHRRFDGRYWTLSIAPFRSTLPPEDAALLKALDRWAATPTDPAYSADIAEALVGCFPGARVNSAAYAQGYGAICEDEQISPDIARAVCRLVRAKQRALPPLADLRAEALKERVARAHLRHDLATYAERHAAAAAKERAEAERIAAAAGQHGIAIGAAEITNGWRAFDADGLWLTERSTRPERDAYVINEWLVLELERGGRHARAAADLIRLVGPYEVQHAAAWEAAALHGADAATTDAFQAQWPAPRDKFAAEVGAFCVLLGLAN